MGVFTQDKIDERTDQEKKEDRYKISQILKRMYFSPANEGYQYLITAIDLYNQDTMFWISGMTKKLYPEIAKMYGKKWSCIERSIRHAIKCAEDRYWEAMKKCPERANKLHDEIFPVGYGKEYRCNKEVIAAIADYISSI